MLYISLALYFSLIVNSIGIANRIASVQNIYILQWLIQRRMCVYECARAIHSSNRHNLLFPFQFWEHWAIGIDCHSADTQMCTIAIMFKLSYFDETKNLFFFFFFAIEMIERETTNKNEEISIWLTLRIRFRTYVFGYLSVLMRKWSVSGWSVRIAHHTITFNYDFVFINERPNWIHASS